MSSHTSAPRTADTAASIRPLRSSAGDGTGFAGTATKLTAAIGGPLFLLTVILHRLEIA